MLTAKYREMCQNNAAVMRPCGAIGGGGSCSQWTAIGPDGADQLGLHLPPHLFLSKADRARSGLVAVPPLTR